MGGVNMLSSERQYKISEIVIKEGKAYISDLVKMFNVSDETIRRDLTVLNKENKIKKVHGGAISIKQPLREESYVKRVTENFEVKQKIGAYASRFISDNDIIAIDSGAATEGLARAILNVSNITIITNSIPVVQILIQKQQHGDFTGKVIFLGGEINCESESAMGSLTNDTLKRFFVDKAFVGATTVSQCGIMVWDANEGIFTASLIEKAGKTFVLAESNKFDKITFYQICSFKDIDGIITDDLCEISAEIKENLHSLHTALHIVSIDSVKDVL